MASLYGANFEIKIDVNSQSLVIAGAAAASLQQQLRFLVREQTIDNKYTAEQLAIIDKTIVSLNQQIQDAKVRNREFFQTLSLIPGPIGQIAGQTQMWITSLRELSRLNLKDITTDIKNIFNSFGGSPIANIGRTTAADLKNQEKGLLDEAAAFTQLASSLGLSAAAFNINTVAGQKNQLSLFNQAKELLALRQIQSSVIETTNLETGALTGYRLVVSDAGKGTSVLKNLAGDLTATQALQIVTSKDLNKTLTEMALANMSAAKAQNATTTAEAANIPVTEANTVATSAWNTTLVITRTVLLGVLGAVTALVAAFYLMYELVPKIRNTFVEWWDSFKNIIVGTAEMEANLKKVGDMIDDTGTILQLDLEQNKRTNAEKISDLKKSRESEKTIREQNLNDIKNNLVRVQQAYDEAKGNIGSVVAAIQKEYGAFGLHPDSKKFDELMSKATKQVEDLLKQRNDLVSELYVKTNEDIEKTDKESFDRRLRNLDARISNETKKEKLTSDQLKAIYNERNNLIDDFYAKQEQRLTKEEELERTKQQKEKLVQYEVSINTKRIENEKSLSEKVLAESSKGTEDYYKTKEQIIEKNFQLEKERARLNEKTQATEERNAQTKRYKDLQELAHEKLLDEVKLKQDQLNGLANQTKDFYEKERELEISRYKEKIFLAQKNQAELEALEKEHKKKMRDIDAQELQYKASIEERKSKTEYQEQENRGKVGVKWIYSHHNKIREINKEIYVDERNAEDLSYQAKKKSAEGNDAELERIETEHAQRVLEIKEQQFERDRYLNAYLLQATEKMGQDLLTIGDVIMQEKQGKDKAAFESGKKLAVAGIIVQKASSIGTIWENNAAANAKARATFWATGGQPFVTINTVLAALDTAATIASAAQAISQINSTDFQAAGGGKGMGKNLATGGMINGPSHADGGVPITAEGGEAVMTRGAVTAFGPLLSMMNQAGGGVSFGSGVMGGARYDAPKITDNSAQQPIIKTYVVEGELTSAQYKAARLKDLSTL
jgi:hypothetical protein